jgi:pimeloyl-ACP methyl ester carboxylesterase
MRLQPWNEALGIARGLLSMPLLASQWNTLPRGKGQPVMVLPGYLAGDDSTVVLRMFLRLLGYQCVGWMQGRNHGNLKKLLPKVDHRVTELQQRFGSPVHLIGWSFGGVVAREVSRIHPEAVAQILTLGTPVRGGPRYTAFAANYRKQGLDLQAIEARVAERNAQPLSTPVAAIYSKQDSVVAWTSCFDPNPHNHVRYVEVNVQHAELVCSPVVFGIIAQQLALNSPTDSP